MNTLDVGQVWVCAAVGSAPPLMCVIGKIDAPERSSGPTIVSITVEPHPSAKKLGWPTVSHMPVFQDAFEASGLVLVKDGATLAPAFTEGYTQWRKQFDEGTAGAFSQLVSAAYEMIASVSELRSGAGQEI